MNVFKKFNFMILSKYILKYNKDICIPISNEINCRIYMDGWKR